jgi:hypothetical protein
MKKKNENDFLGFFECGRVCRTTVVVLLVVASDVRPPVVAFPAKELVFIIMHSPANKNISQVCCNESDSINKNEVHSEYHTSLSLGADEVDQDKSSLED